MADLDTKALVEAAVQTPQAASANGVSVTSRSVADQIAAANWLASKAAVKRAGWPMRMLKIVPPGAV